MNVGNKRGSNIKYLPYAFTEQGVAMSAEGSKVAYRNCKFHDGEARLRVCDTVLSERTLEQFEAS